MLSHQFQIIMKIPSFYIINHYSISFVHVLVTTQNAFLTNLKTLLVHKKNITLLQSMNKKRIKE